MEITKASTNYFRSVTYFYVFGGQLSFCEATGTLIFDF